MLLPPLTNLPGKLITSNSFALDKKTENDKSLSTPYDKKIINPITTDNVHLQNSLTTTSLNSLLVNAPNGTSTEYMQFKKVNKISSYSSNLPRPKSSLKKRLSYCLQPLKHLGPIIALFLYTVIGAAVFQELELKNEIAEEKINKEKFQMLMANVCSVMFNDTIVDNGVIFSHENLSSCLSAIEPVLSSYMKRYFRGFNGELRNWDFEGAAFFAITVYTTIGEYTVVCMF